MGFGGHCEVGWLVLCEEFVVIFDDDGCGVRFCSWICCGIWCELLVLWKLLMLVLLYVDLCCCYCERRDRQICLLACCNSCRCETAYRNSRCRQPRSSDCEVCCRGIVPSSLLTLSLLKVSCSLKISLMVEELLSQELLLLQQSTEKLLSLEVPLKMLLSLKWLLSSGNLPIEKCSHR